MDNVTNSKVARQMESGVDIRNEEPADHAGITNLIVASFQDVPYSDHREQDIVTAMRQQGQLAISMVATDQKAVVGYIAISPVTVSTGQPGWYGLGPLAVHPDRQRQGVGSRLVKAALKELQSRSASGCVVLGDSKYYLRFGFEHYPSLTSTQFPKAKLLALAFFDEKIPEGSVTYHESFIPT